jgi:hypothetical protein
MGNLKLAVDQKLLSSTTLLSQTKLVVVLADIGAEFRQPSQTKLKRPGA